MRKPPLASLWSTDASLSVLLSFLVLVIFVVYPLGALGIAGHLFVGLGFSIILISGVLAVAKNFVAGLLAGCLALVTLAQHWIPLAIGRTPSPLLDCIMSLVAIGTLVFVVLVQVFREGPITLHRVQGAIVVYLLLGLGWGFAYQLVRVHDPGAFQINSGAPGTSTLGLEGALMYFSFVTLTTTGYGDVVAVNPVARSLALLEALVGQLYPAILIARLVSMQLLHDRRVESGR